MAPKVTSSSNRNKRSSAKPVTKGQNPQRANRQATSRATVSQSGGSRGSGARVTNASQRTTSGSARVTGGARPALPPGRSGGALATRPPTQSTRQANAKARLRDASRGSTGPNRVGQPAGSANRMFGANVVNNSVNRAIAATRLAGLSTAAQRLLLPVAIANQAKNVVGGFQKLANHPFLKGRPKPAKPTAKPQRQGPAVPARLANAPAAPKLPKPPAATASTRPSRSSSASTPARTPSRPSAPARPAASRPAATPAKATPKPSLRPDTVQGTGPIKDGGTYARNVKKQPTSGNSFAGSKDMSASEMAASYNTTTNYGSRVNTAFSAESPSTKPSTPKKKSSALSQAEIRKRRLNR